MTTCGGCSLLNPDCSTWLQFVLEAAFWALAGLVAFFLSGAELPGFGALTGLFACRRACFLPPCSGPKRGECGICYYRSCITCSCCAQHGPWFGVFVGVWIAVGVLCCLAHLAVFVLADIAAFKCGKLLERCADSFCGATGVTATLPPSSAITLSLGNYEQLNVSELLSAVDTLLAQRQAGGYLCDPRTIPLLGSFNVVLLISMLLAFACWFFGNFTWIQALQVRTQNTETQAAQLVLAHAALLLRTASDRRATRLVIHKQWRLNAHVFFALSAEHERELWLCIVKLQRLPLPDHGRRFSYRAATIAKLQRLATARSWPNLNRLRATDPLFELHALLLDAVRPLDEFQPDQVPPTIDVQRLDLCDSLASAHFLLQCPARSASIWAWSGSQADDGMIAVESYRERHVEEPHPDIVLLLLRAVYRTPDVPYDRILQRHCEPSAAQSPASAGDWLRDAPFLQCLLDDVMLVLQDPTVQPDIISELDAFCALLHKQAEPLTNIATPQLHFTRATTPRADTADLSVSEFCRRVHEFRAHHHLLLNKNTSGPVHTVQMRTLLFQPTLNILFRTSVTMYRFYFTEFGDKETRQQALMDIMGATPALQQLLDPALRLRNRHALVDWWIAFISFAELKRTTQAVFKRSIAPTAAALREASHASDETQIAPHWLRVSASALDYVSGKAMAALKKKHSVDTIAAPDPDRPVSAAGAPSKASAGSFDISRVVRAVLDPAAFPMTNVSESAAFPPAGYPKRVPSCVECGVEVANEAAAHSPLPPLSPLDQLAPCGPGICVAPDVAPPLVCLRSHCIARHFVRHIARARAPPDGTAVEPAVGRAIDRLLSSPLLGAFDALLEKAAATLSVPLAEDVLVGIRQRMREPLTWSTAPQWVAVDTHIQALLVGLEERLGTGAGAIGSMLVHLQQFVQHAGDATTQDSSEGSSEVSISVGAHLLDTVHERAKSKHQLDCSLLHAHASGHGRADSAGSDGRSQRDWKQSRGQKRDTQH